MGEGDLQIRKSVEHATHHHRADGHRGLRRHADEPGHPVVGHAGTAQHVPGVHEHAGAQLFRGLENPEDLGVVQIPALDVASDLYPRHLEFRDHAFKFTAGKVRILHRHGAQPDEPVRKVRDDARDVIVEMAREIEGVGRLRPVREHHGDRGEHLHSHAVSITLGDSDLRIP